MPSEEFKYALWYLTENGWCDTVEVFDTEKAAASAAVTIYEYTEGDVYGVQRSDGALEPIRTWPAFQVALEEARARASEIMTEPAPPQHKVKNPFDERRKVWVLDDMPEWIGDPVA